jgi:hypothetical protein
MTTPARCSARRPGRRSRITLGCAVALRANRVTEIGVRADHDSLLPPGGSKNRLVRCTQEFSVAYVDGIVTGVGEERGDPVGKALVDQNPHADGRKGRVRSSTAAAANLSASRTSSVLSCG